MSKCFFRVYLYNNLNRLTKQGECTGQNPSASDAVTYLQNYYDDYSYRSQTGFNNSNFTDGGTTGKGYLTGSITTVLGSSDSIYSANYYDIKGKVTGTVHNNLLGGYDITSTVYTFSDKPATVTHTHTASGKATHTEVYTYTYDQADRVSKVEHTLNGIKVTLVNNTYDSFGRLSAKALHGSATNKLTYTYNVRSWPTCITGTPFTQNLYYNTGNGTPCYNGNISSMTWNGNDGITRGYKFGYDGLSRMLTAAYGETAAINTNLDRFTEKISGYDKNGNITSLQRYGQVSASSYGLVDNLTFTLNGNQLNRVDDAVTAVAYNDGFEFKDAVKQANEYTYDANGNLTKDLNKGITGIQYNVLNLPSKVTFSDGSTIAYFYSADGTKLRTTHTISGTVTTTDYCGNVIYENGTAKRLLTEAGYVSLNDNKYHYYLQDHQGNNRVVVDQNGNVEETNNYYPFGGVFASTGNIQPYKYNGKEFDSKKGLNWYDYGARHYDAALGHWHVVDPLNETNYASGYSYCLNNPSRYIDVMGLDTISINNIPERNARFNPRKDVIALNEVVVTGNRPSSSVGSSFGMDALNIGLNFGGTAVSTAASMRYTERPWGNGYFTTQGGKAYSMSILNKQANGKYVRGVQGLRIGAKAAENSTRLLRTIGNATGHISTAWGLYNFWKEPNWINASDLGFGIASYFLWEIGAAYTSSFIYYDCVVKPNIEQIQDNIINGVPPTRNVYNPQTGMYDY